MSRTVERRWAVVVAGYAVFVALVILAAIPVYRLAEPSWRPGVVRIAAALILSVGLLHARGTLRAVIEEAELARVAQATHQASLEPSLDRQFIECRNSIKWSMRDHRYFERTLWPRLRVLGIARSGARRESLSRPPGRAFRRGPSLTALRELVATLESRQ